MKKVLIIYKYLPQYRMEFFEQLKTQLVKYNVELQLIHGKSNKVDALKKDEANIEWANCIPNRTIKAGSKVLIWQPVLSFLKNKDLIITLPENKLLLNYYLMISRHFSKYKFAYWGHVYNMQKDLKSLRNIGKLMFLNRCDWWFGYTNSSKRFLVNRNYPENKITVVQNSIATSALRKCYSDITEKESHILKKELGITGNNIAIYCGAMYPEKDFDFILEACGNIKKELPDFHMIFIGSGIESKKITNAEKKSPWIHYVGPKFGKDRVIYFKISSIQLMPRLVGLAIIDSFALETPIITTTNSFHGPEIEYLENDVNGVKTDDNLNDYSQAIIKTLKDKKYNALTSGCKSSAEKYTIDKMVENFLNGILMCLNN